MSDSLLIIAASGPSLTPEVVERVADSTARVLCVCDAVFRFTYRAAALVASDPAWWRVHHDRLALFRGDRILPIREKGAETAEGTRVIQSSEGEGFTPFNAGPCSLFAALSFALCAGEKRIALVGADMRVVDGRVHYFGHHPTSLRQPANYHAFLPDFDEAAAHLPAGVEIINATPGSALKCFPFQPLEQVLQ